MARFTVQNKTSANINTPQIDIRTAASNSIALLEQNGTVLGSGANVPEANQIFDNLMNEIGLVTLVHQSLSNPLSVFKGGNMSVGLYHEEIATDIIEEMDFQGIENPQDQFKPSLQQVLNAYHSITRMGKFRTSIPDTRMDFAATSLSTMGGVCQQFIEKLSQSDTMYEWLYAKRALVDFIYQKAFPLQDTQKITVPRAVMNPQICDKDVLAQFILDVKNLISLLPFNNRKYSCAGLAMQTPSTGLVLLLRASAKNQNEVQNLANAFNPQFMAMGVDILVVDDFGYGGEDVVGILMDKRAFMIVDYKYMLTPSVPNYESLYFNRFLHHWQGHHVSPFHQFVALMADGASQRNTSELPKINAATMEPINPMKAIKT